MSPVFARVNGLVFYFYLADLVEPPHAHVGIGKSMTPADAKIWLDPVSTSRTGRLSGQQMRDALRIAKENQDFWLQTWRQYERTSR